MVQIKSESRVSLSDTFITSYYSGYFLILKKITQLQIKDLCRYPKHITCVEKKMILAVYN